MNLMFSLLIMQVIVKIKININNLKKIMILNKPIYTAFNIKD